MSAKQVLTESPLSVVHEVLRDWLEENDPTDFDENDVAHFFGMLGTAGYSIVPNAAPQLALDRGLARLDEAVAAVCGPHAGFNEDLRKQGKAIDKLEMLWKSTMPGLLSRAAEAQVTKVYEVIDKEFDQHHRDSKSNCTAQQAQFYTHCEGAIAMLRMHLEAVVPEPKPAPVAKPKPAPIVVPSKEALAALFWEKYRYKLTRKDEPLEADDIRDIMPFGEDGELHVQVHMRGFTDWYSLKFDAAGQPDPATIEQLPF